MKRRRSAEVYAWEKLNNQAAMISARCLQQSREELYCYTVYLLNNGGDGSKECSEPHFGR
jgi:hypothetical protein